MTNEYSLGVLVRSSAPFTDTGGSPADPTTVTCQYRIGNGEITTFTYGTDSELVRDSLGNFHVDIETPAAGVYFVRWNGTGAITVADEDSFIIVKSRIIQ